MNFPNARGIRHFGAYSEKSKFEIKIYRDFRARVLENTVCSCAPCRNATLLLFSFHIHTLTKEHTGRLEADNFFEPPSLLFCFVMGEEERCHNSWTENPPSSFSLSR